MWSRSDWIVLSLILLNDIFLSSVIIMNKKNMVVDRKYLFSFFYIIRFRFEYSQMVTINDGDGQDLPCLPECM